MKASIIIASYNGARYLEGCLSSVLAQQFDGGFEVIVVDNGSSDDTVELVQTRFPQVRVFPEARNTGFAAACNKGSQIARGRVLIFLNQDTVATSGWLDELVAALDRDPLVGLATSKILQLAAPDRIDTCGVSLHYTGLGQVIGKLLPAESFSKAAVVDGVCGASFAISRELWNQLGGFDEALFMYYEDVDLSWRAQLAGYMCLYVPTSVVYHDSRAEPSPLAFSYQARNRHILRLKNWRWQTLVLMTPAFLLTETVDVVRHARRGRSFMSMKVNTYVSAIKLAPAILRKRPAIQSRRLVSDNAILAKWSSRLYLVRQTSRFEQLFLESLTLFFEWHRSVVVTLLRWGGL